MSSSDFSEIALKRERGRSERLFRAAVTAFASLTRPSRREIAQLEDLVLPLYDAVSADARRFVAAALSEVEHAPAALIRRLADENVEIAAPVLLRSKVLGDVDLIGLIGRHGLPHARVIASRQGLHPTIAQLAAALARSERRRELRDAITVPVTVEDSPMQPSAATATAEPAPTRRKPGEAAEDVRSQLRTMMQPSAGGKPARSGPPDPGRRQDTHSKLRESALTGVRAFFQTALADALGIGFGQARAIVAASDLTDLTAALKSLELSEELAFVIVAALYPARFPHAEAIRLFLDRYRLLHREAAADRMRGWKEAALAAALPSFAAWQAEQSHEPANNPGRPQAFGTRPRVANGEW